MISILNLKKYFINSYKKEDIPLFLFLFFLFVSTFNPYRLEEIVKYLILPSALLGLAIPYLIRSWKYWFLLSLLLLFNLVFNFFNTSNHLFIATYFAWTVALILISKEDFFITLRSCSRYILILVMGMATLHKITSPEFTSGSFMTYEFLLGIRKFFLLEIIWADLGKIFSVNRTNVTDMISEGSAQISGADLLSPGDEFFIFTKVFSYFTIFFEAALFLSFVFYARLNRVTHILLILFIWFTYLYTNENSFFSMLCILGYLLSYKENKKIRIMYTATVIIMLIMDLAKFRPGILV